MNDLPYCHCLPCCIAISAMPYCDLTLLSYSASNSILFASFLLSPVPLLPNDRGRRHLAQQNSDTEAFRPSRRVLTPGYSGAKHARVQGLARVEPVAHPTPRAKGVRTNSKAAGRSGYDVPDPGLVVSERSKVTAIPVTMCNFR